MTMSVGLGRIINDPDASTIIRKALGVLSTPGLLVHDKGLSIDDSGRIIVQLKPDGGLTEDEHGLSLTPVVQKIGIDSEVDPRSEAYDRKWNARLTGPAPNYFEGSLAIGSESLSGESVGLDAIGGSVEDAKVQINCATTQLRLSYDLRNYLAFRVLKSGIAELFCIGETTSTPGIHIQTGDGSELASGVSGGLRLNGGSILQTFYAAGINASFAGGGTVGSVNWQEVTYTINGSMVYPRGSTVFTLTLVDSAGPPSNVMSWSARMVADNEFGIRISWFDALAPVSMTFLVLFQKTVG